MYVDGGVGAGAGASARLLCPASDHDIHRLPTYLLGMCFMITWNGSRMYELSDRGDALVT
jgi:hypothetical protein